MAGGQASSVKEAGGRNLVSRRQDIFIPSPGDGVAGDMNDCGGGGGHGPAGLLRAVVHRETIKLRTAAVGLAPQLAGRGAQGLRLGHVRARVATVPLPAPLPRYSPRPRRRPRGRGHCYHCAAGCAAGGWVG